MATVLENYYALRGELEQRMAQAPINAVDLWYYGEIVYRVGVLETCQMYLRSAPVSMNTPELLGHYQMMDAYVQSCVGTSLWAGPRSGYTERAGSRSE